MRKSKGVLALLVFALMFVMASEACAVGYYYPKMIYLGDAAGNRITPPITVSQGVQTYYIYAAKEDGADGPATTKEAYRYYQDVDEIITTVTKSGAVTSVIASAVGTTLAFTDPFNYSKQLSVVTATFVNSGTEDATGEIGSIVIEFKNGGESLDNAAQTAPIAVKVRAGDGDSGGDDGGGGSCDVLGIGALALVLPLLASRRKK